MSYFNHFILICLTTSVTSLPSQNVTNSSYPIIQSPTESVSIFKSSPPEEKLPQHLGREGIISETKDEDPQKIRQFKISTVKAENSDQAGEFSKTSTVTASSTVTKNTTELKNTSVASPIKKHTTIKPHKPMKTVHDDIPAVEKLKMITPDIPNINEKLNKKTKRANYVIPIVVVILSVPLVTIIISLLFKRTKDWWQHRNYRRMDYLIEGMYNS